ncbi:MAG: 16S rRNA processing protein RimM [Candidatus Aminicenantes bacterium]|nr:16S rRNA processing protein RimM [Candidatus Aminicenantes bacterium]
MKKVELVAVGRVIRSEGKDGTLKIKLYSWIKREPFFKKVYLEKEGELREYEVEKFNLVRNSPFLKLKGVEDQKRADELRGREIFVSSEDFPPLENDTYYDFELLGCRVETVDGELIGKVVELLTFGSNVLLVVQAGQKQLEIPLVKAICQVIDVESGLIKVDPPEGLLELNEV